MDPFEYPQHLTQNADEDSKRLWDSLWRTVAKLTLRDELLEEMQARIRALESTKQ